MRIRIINRRTKNIHCEYTLDNIYHFVPRVGDTIAVSNDVFLEVKSVVVYVKIAMIDVLIA